MTEEIQNIITRLKDLSKELSDLTFPYEGEIEYIYGKEDGCELAAGRLDDLVYELEKENQ